MATPVNECAHCMFGGEARATLSQNTKTKNYANEPHMNIEQWKLECVFFCDGSLFVHVFGHDGYRLQDRMKKEKKTVRMRICAN